MRLFAVAVSCLTIGFLPAQGPSRIEIKTSTAWVDTGLDVDAGETLRIEAGGGIEYADPKAGKLIAAPQGLSRGWKDLLRAFPVNGAGRGALIAKWGEQAVAVPFLVGAKWEGKAPVKARLFLGINQAAPEATEGGYTVTVTRVAPAPARPTAEKLNLPAFTQELLDQIPPRVQDAQGTPGDRVNFVIIGPKARVEEGFRNGGWLIVDKNVKAAVMTGVLATLQRQSYLTMPMSELKLFDRTQDFGYAKGDPLKVVAERHHFRLWQAPFDLNGHTVWAGAGTHDIGFDKDQRNGNVTHKIDPDVDKEREFIGESLKATGLVARTEYMTPKSTIITAKTAHGEEFHSDGRTLIIYLQP